MLWHHLWCNSFVSLFLHPLAQATRWWNGLCVLWRTSPTLKTSKNWIQPLAVKMTLLDTMQTSPMQSGQGNKTYYLEKSVWKTPCQIPLHAAWASCSRICLSLTRKRNSFVPLGPSFQQNNNWKFYKRRISVLKTTTPDLFFSQTGIVFNRFQNVSDKSCWTYATQAAQLLENSLGKVGVLCVWTPNRWRKLNGFIVATHHKRLNLKWWRILPKKTFKQFAWWALKVPWWSMVGRWCRCFFCWCLLKLTGWNDEALGFFLQWYFSQDMYIYIFVALW